MERKDLIPWLGHDGTFPPVERAMRSPNGLLAAGGDLSAARLLGAYRHGIFPWFSAGEPVLWWSPDPRMVLIPDEFKISRSLSRVLRNSSYEVRTDTAFEQVMRCCAAPRRIYFERTDEHTQTSSHTWISEEMITAYCALHELGFAHSVETWMNGRLAGGLYGVSIGRMFYGESMFSRASNASKIALAYLSRQLQRWNAGLTCRFGSGLIDCQMNTPHLASLGAREISRQEFIAGVKELVNCAPVANWQFDRDLFQ